METEILEQFVNKIAIPEWFDPQLESQQIKENLFEDIDQLIWEVNPELNPATRVAQLQQREEARQARWAAWTPLDYIIPPQTSHWRKPRRKIVGMGETPFTAVITALAIAIIFATLTLIALHLLISRGAL